MFAMVSIILPNLNTPLPFLEERIRSIQSQTCTGWECIIIDGYSTNGSWEYLSQVAGADQRFQAYRFKKEGIYKAWNSGIGLAKGRYVYIATSDDTMAPDCLSKMQDALEDFPEAGLVHCCLTIIDKNGRPSPEANWDDFYPTRYFGGLIKKRHIRLAPYDGILHCGIKTVYTSVTQLLIRRSVFEKVGLFLTDKGSMADFEWGMRASLVCNVLHIPEYLATWRRHDGQATHDSMQYRADTYELLRTFIRHAFRTDNEKGLLRIGRFNIPGLEEMYLQREMIIRLGLQPSAPGRMKVYVKYFIKCPAPVIRYLYNWYRKHRTKDEISWVREKIRAYKLEGHLKEV